MEEKKLTLEINSKYELNHDVEALKEEGIFVTPPIGGDRDWLFRVDVGHGQAVIGFPKFNTIGIGFEKEEDWNTNLPWTSKALAIYGHIEHNKTDGPEKEDCIAAIEMIQQAAREFIRSRVSED